MCRIKTRINYRVLSSFQLVAVRMFFHQVGGFLCHQLLINGEPTGRTAAVKKRKKASNRSFPQTFSVPIPVMRLLLIYVASVLKHVAQRRRTSSDPFRSLLILFVDSRLFPFILAHPRRLPVLSLSPAAGATPVCSSLSVILGSPHLPVLKNLSISARIFTSLFHSLVLPSRFSM